VSMASRVLISFSPKGDKSKPINVALTATVHHLKLQLRVDKLTRHAPDRIRLTIPDKDGKPIPLQDEKTLESYGIKENAIISFKDLGPQVGYQTVFYVEYLGPLLIYPLFILPATRSLIYGTRTPYVMSTTQTIALICWVAHYVKREFETAFVHKFSHGTMPIFNIFKNSIYYWGCGAAIAYFVNHPRYTPPPFYQTQYALVFFVICELLNFVAHVQLSAMRPSGSKEYVLPRGLLFDFITCPNYTFEILSWVAFSFLTQTAAAYAFTIFGFVQMWQWAKQKHARLAKIFPPNKENKSQPHFSKRKALIFPPFI